MAHANIALIKYWGKRDPVLNLPAVGSISITLKELFTHTEVRFAAELVNDRFILNGEHKDIKQHVRIKKFLDLIRERSDIQFRAEIISENNFPTGAGLASSASGFAALTLASCKAAGLELSKKEMSILARIGSGSAPVRWAGNAV